MGLITEFLDLPLKPARAAVWVAEKLKEAAEAEYYDPAVVRNELAKVEDAHAAGELTDEQRDDLQRALLNRLMEAQNRTEEM